MKVKLKKINKNKTTDNHTPVKITGRKAIYVILAIFIAFTLIVTNFELDTNKVDVKVGDICPENIIAPRRIVDAKMTEALRTQAENSTAPVYDIIASANVAAQEQADKFFNAVSATDASSITSSAASSLNNIYSVSLMVSDYNYLKNLTAEEYGSLYSNTTSYIEEAFKRELKAETFDSEKNAILANISDSELSESEIRIISQVVGSVLRPNMILNDEATRLARANARDSVYEVVYEAGQTIVNRGEVITEHHIDLLGSNGLLTDTGLFKNAAVSVGRPMLIILATMIFVAYLNIQHKELIGNVRRLAMMLMLSMLILPICKGASFISVYLMPTAAFAMCASMIFGKSMAYELGIFGLIITSVALQLDVDGVLYLTVGTFAGLVYLGNLTSRTDIYKISMRICVYNVFAVFANTIIRSSLSVATTVEIVYAILGGVLSGVSTTVIVSIFEVVFNVATPFKLMELGSPGFPLMQKLVSRAQGTYHHCLIVSNMSESAAENIGANALLARVGAYYHDIGKSENPEYFSENQQGMKNPHDLLEPEVSANIIKNHVTEGVALAEKYRLPKAVKRFIVTHHGSSEISYFKFKASQNGYDGEEDFRYHGELPRSKEETIVMIADSVEAAVKSMDKPSEENIINMINSIINKKMAEGQFYESELDFEELETVKRSFLEVLSGVYHSRVKYPNQVE